MTTISSGQTVFLSAGQTSSGFIVLAGGILDVQSGAVVINTVDSGGIDNISSGGTASGTTLFNGGSEVVFVGGTTSNAVISSGGQLVVSGEAAYTAILSGGELDDFGFLFVVDVGLGGTLSLGGFSDDTVIEDGGVEFVVVSGESFATNISSGGQQNVYGTASGTSILGGGMQLVFSGGRINTTVVSGGNLFVGAGGTSSNTTIMSGGVENVSAGGTDSAAVIVDGGVEYIESGGAATGTIVSSGGALSVTASGTTSATTISSGGLEVVSSGGEDFGTTVSGFGVQHVFGTTHDATVVRFGSQTVESGGIASGSIIGWSETISSGGQDFGTTVLSGSSENVYGTASGVVVSGSQLVASGGTAVANTVYSGGLQLVASGGTVSATTVSSGGTLDVYDSATLAGAIFNDGTLSYDITGSMTLSGPVTGGGRLLMSGGGALTVVSAYTGDASVEGYLEFTSTYVGTAGFGDPPSGPGSTLKFDAGSTGPVQVVNSHETVIAQPGNDNWIDALVNYTLPANIDTLFMYNGNQGTGNSDAAGNALYALNLTSAQTLIGNTANDAFVVYNSADVVVPKAGSHDTVYAGPNYTLPTGVDVLILEGGGTQGVGNSDAAGDALWATSLFGAATLTGNSANDVFVIYNSADVVVPKAGSHDSVYSAVNYTLPTGIDVLSLEAGTQGVGNSDASGDALYAADAGIAQTLTGNSANDTFVVYNSADVVVPKAGSHDTVYSAVNYILPTAVDTLFLEAGTQGVGNSDAAGDVLYAADAGIGQTLTGNSVNDTFVVDNAADVVVPEVGSTDTVYTAANFTLPTNVDTLLLEGTASQGTGNNDAANALFGNGSVASTLVAGSGADTLNVTGTAGTILTGGAGHDTFAFPNVMGHDEVTNFDVTKDTLRFNATLFANFTAAMNAASQSGANTVFTIDTNDTVTLDNVTKTSLTARNFHFV